MSESNVVVQVHRQWWLVDAAGHCRGELTKREVSVCELLAMGWSHHEVAAMLQISVATVRSHRARALKTLKLRNDVEICRFALARGLIETPTVFTDLPDLPELHRLLAANGLPMPDDSLEADGGGA